MKANRDGARDDLADILPPTFSGHDCAKCQAGRWKSLPQWNRLEWRGSGRKVEINHSALCIDDQPGFFPLAPGYLGFVSEFDGRDAVDE